MATETGTTRQVFEHHLGALSAGDLDGILSDYTDDSIVIGPDGALKGRQAIRGFFEGVLASLFKPLPIHNGHPARFGRCRLPRVARGLRVRGHRIRRGYILDQRWQDRGPDFRREDRTD
jgi:SnoaL-like domain